jgi:hypothetical protein
MAEESASESRLDPFGNLSTNGNAQDSPQEGPFQSTNGHSSQEDVAAALQNNPTGAQQASGQLANTAQTQPQARAAESNAEAAEAGAARPPATAAENAESTATEEEAEQAEEAVLPDLQAEYGIDPAEVPDHIETRDEAAQYASYYQRKAQLAEEIAEEVLQDQQDFQQMRPVLDLVRDDPEVQEFLAQKLQGSMEEPQGAGNGAQHGAGRSPLAEAPARPEKPDKPDNFDAYEAQTDPNSESAQYMRDLADFQEEMAEYTEQAADAKLNQFAQQQKQVQQQRQAQQAYQQLKQQVMYEQGADEKTADKFLEWASSENSLNDLDAWWAAYQATHGEGPQPTTQQPTMSSENPPQGQNVQGTNGQAQHQQGAPQTENGPQHFPESPSGQPSRQAPENTSTNDDIFAHEAQQRPDIFGGPLQNG